MAHHKGQPYNVCALFPQFEHAIFDSLIMGGTPPKNY